MSLCGFALTGCSKLKLASLTQTPTPSVAPTSAPTEKPFTVTLKAQKNSRQSGTAQFEDVGGGKTKVTISLTGDAPTVPQPAHIHTGTCIKSGNILYPLTDVIQGKSETIVNASIPAIQTNGMTVINVHKSAADMDIKTTCGELPSAPKKK